MKSNIQTPDRRVVSAILILFISLLTAMMNCNNLTPNGSTDLHAETGTAQINIDIGAIGTIAKKKTIELERLIFTLSCSDEDTIRDTIDISGSGGNNVQKTIGDLAAPKQWRLSAITLDEQDSCIHAGSTTFTTEPADTIDVSLELDARFSMLRVSFNGIPDSATTLSIDVDAGDFSSDSTFEATSRDTVVLTYDYLTATAEGDTHTVSLNVRGVYHGISTILYTADTTLTVISGEDRNYTVTLTWVGPFINEPPVFSTEETDMTDSIYAGTVYRDTVSFSDPDGDDVTLLFGEHPDGMTVEDSIILWTTELSDTGNHTIILIARNGNGGYDTLEWTIEVVPPPVSNHPPVFTSSASDMLSSVYVDSDYIDTIHATDSDGDEISFTLIGDAEGLTLDDTILTWMPTEDDIGTYNISAIADDGNGGTDTLEWTIRVRSNSTPDYPEIPFDSIMTGEINPSVDVDQYWFQGTAGDIITLRVDPDGGGNSAYPDSRILLINPDDSVLINQNVPNSELNTIEDYVLPATGQYVIRVMESEGDQAFNYQIGLYSRQHTRTNGTAIEFAVPDAGTVSSTVSVNCYLFSGTAGDIITLRLDPDGGGNSAYPDSRILLINPDDSVLINQNVPNSELNTIEDYVLPATGQYVIRVMESEGDQAFSYSIILIN